MIEAERDSFVEDKLACEHEGHLKRQDRLLNAVRKVLAEKDLSSLLQIVADASRDLTGARYVTTGHGYVNGVFIAGGSSRSEGAMPCPTGKEFNAEKGGVYLSLIREKESIRLTDAEMRSDPAWWGLPEDHAPLRGLLGVRLVDVNGLPNGLIMASDKEDGGDFTAEDEKVLSQLAAMVSLALQHIDARTEVENEKLRLEAVLEALPVGMAVTDVNGVQIKSNSAFEQIWGGQRPPVASIGDYAAYKAWWADTGKLVEPDEWASIQAVKTGKPTVGQVMEIQQFDGTHRFVINSGAPIRDASSNIVGSAAAVQDITELKEAEKALQESVMKAEQRGDEVDAALSSIAAGVTIYDKSGKIVRMNDTALNMLGLSSSDLDPNNYDLRKTRIGTSKPDGTPLKTEEAPYYRALHGEFIVGEEVLFKQSRHEPLWVSTAASPIRSSRGDITGAIAIFTDITDRKHMEEALRKAKDDLEQKVLERTAELTETNLALKESEDRFRVALKSAPLVVFNQDRELRYTWLYNPNPGFTQDSTLGKTDEELLPPEDAAQLTKIKRRVLESGYGERAEVRTTIDGEEFFYDLTVEPLRNASGEIEGITCATMDITYRKKAEEEMKRAKEAAEAASRAKAEFLASMSHEIRTPMNAIIGMTALMLDEPLDPIQRENLELVRTSGDALLTIINDILDFSKMESDKLVLEDQTFNLRSCVEESIDLVAIKAAEKGLNLAYTIDKKVPVAIIGDPGRLRQVMGNLLSNAVKFTDKGEVTLSVSIDESNEVHFAVQDTGIGIPQGSMHQLFQPFSQMEPSITRLYGGTGLGLAISKKLVELMDGRIWAESQEGIGSTFHFTIKAPSDQSEVKTSAVSPQMISRHVLIVEDNKTNRRILSKQVYDWGMVPMAASSGQEALNWIRRGDDFDIAILDMDLPDMSGLELEDEIRKYNGTLPLVLLVSLGKRILPNHAYLTKPIKPSKLYQVMIDILPKEPTKRPVQQVLANQSTQSHPLRILIAEDNISHQKVTQQMLKRLGYKADAVANGIEVLHALERQHYDVVFMDVKMPVMDGLEAARVIRQRWPNGPKIIALTAYGLKGDRERFIEAGMDDYISKPVQKEDLAKVLRRYG